MTNYNKTDRWIIAYNTILFAAESQITGINSTLLILNSVREYSSSLCPNCIIVEFWYFPDAGVSASEIDRIIAAATLVLMSTTTFTDPASGLAISTYLQATDIDTAQTTFVPVKPVDGSTGSAKPVTKDEDKDMTSTIIIACAVGGGVLALALFGGFIWYCHGRCSSSSSKKFTRRMANDQLQGEGESDPYAGVYGVAMTSQPTATPAAVATAPPAAAISPPAPVEHAVSAPTPRVGPPVPTRPSRASPPPPAAVPQSDWSKQIDGDSGYPYYFNAKTGESSWTVPDGYVEPVAATGEGETSDY
jgi:hypothetical protein